MIQWSYNDGCVVPPARSNNVFVAAFTMAYAREGGEGGEREREGKKMKRFILTQD